MGNQEQNCGGIDWEQLRQRVLMQYPGPLYSIHGPSHWRQVEDHGLRLARQSGAVVVVVRLFALFHDSRRTHDGICTAHGRDGAEYAARLRGEYFELADDDFERLQYACQWHAHGRLSDDPTIGTCWDADRLDLGRAGIQPDPQLMSTEAARRWLLDGSCGG